MALCSNVKTVWSMASPTPPVAVNARDVYSGEGVNGEQTIVADLELAVLARAHLRGDCLIAAVKLRGVPPVRLGVDEGRGFVGVARRARRVAARATHEHRAIRPRVVVAQGNLNRVLFLVMPVAHPVVNHELNPRGGQQIDDGGGLEGVAGHQLKTDRARAGLEERGRFLGDDLIERHVTTEAGSDAAHPRLPEVVVGSVTCESCAPVAGVAERRRVVRRDDLRGLKFCS